MDVESQASSEAKARELDSGIDAREWTLTEYNTSLTTSPSILNFRDDPDSDQDPSRG
jgi:hypothetical protein